MTIRTTKKTVTFVRPLTLSPLDEVLQPGDYDVEIDEEQLEGLSFPAYRRILALVHLPVQIGRPGLSRTLSIDPNELDAALESLLRNRVLWLWCFSRNNRPVFDKFRLR